LTSVGFTRPRGRLADGEKTVLEAGFEPFGAPSLDAVPGDDEVFDEIERTLESGEAYFTVFASQTAVEQCAAHYGKEKLLALLEKTNVACTGSTTEKLLYDTVGRKTDLVPEVYSGEGVAREISDEVAYKTVVLLRSEDGGKDISRILTEAKAKVLDEPVYRMEPAPVEKCTERLLDKASSGTLDALLMTSPASFRVFLKELENWCGKEKAAISLKGIYKVAIGKPTADSMREMGFAPDAIAEKSTFPGMLETVKKHFA
jgi:uroporphyrinogen-III synthase